nr:6-hydroxymethylpterin diphosphokinase MptE-like protein [uncultured Treponema sp.]
MIKDNFDISASNGISKTDAPSLYECRQGVSVLYRERFLYSKYDPSKSILNIISNLTVNPGTLVLVMSPALFLGYTELTQKLSDQCKIICFEFDKQLYDFSKNYIPQDSKDTKIYSEENIKEYIDFINTNHFRKVIRIDFSGGTIFNKEKYDNIFSVTQSVIDQFWKNRLTLIRFGRIFSKNIFKNLVHLADSIPFKSLYKTVDKPILVLGAGESLDKTIQTLKEKKQCGGQDTDSDKIFRDIFFILCVDAALNPLLESNIIPDAVVAVECQSIIEKAYIGKSVLSKVPLFSDLVSRSSIPEILGGPVSFFVSEYSNMTFLKTLSEKEILPPVIKPLGSVGLVASEIALRLRKNDDVKIFFSGLDFSFTAGITHAKETPSHKRQLFKNHRLTSVYNIDSAFAPGTSQITGKNERRMTTSKALISYALLFTEQFSDIKNFFDAGVSGVSLNAKQMDLASAIKDFALIDKNTDSLFKEKLSLKNSDELKNKILTYIKEEKEELTKLIDLLSLGDKSRYRNAENTLDTQLDLIITGRDYLYIHFADAQKNTNRQSFLNRIKIESNIFLKQLKTAQDMMEK